jgi:hypothetical protein
MRTIEILLRSLSNVSAVLTEKEKDTPMEQAPWLIESIMVLIAAYCSVGDCALIDRMN